MNRRIEPAVFIVERALLVVFAGAMVAVLCHDIGYNLREGLDNAGWFKGARAASSGRRRAKPATTRNRSARMKRRALATASGRPAKSVQGQACELLGVRLGATTRESTRLAQR